MTEKALSECVRRLAKLTGWLAYHTHRSQHSAAGFPDWIMLKGGWLLAVELKSEKGKITDSQLGWLRAFGEFGHHTEGFDARIYDSVWHEGRRIHVAIWRPADWHSGLIERVLKHGPGGIADPGVKRGWGTRRLPEKGWPSLVTPEDLELLKQDTVPEVQELIKREMEK